MRTNLNYLQIYNNTFANNVCVYNGGLFNFLTAFFNVTSLNNSYTHNAAGRSGGVGYTYRSELFYFEDHGYYYSKGIINII